jgi:hypothetical protein
LNLFLKLPTIYFAYVHAFFYWFALLNLSSRVGPIYRLADVFGRYQYWYIGIGKLDISINLIGIGICIGNSGYRLYRYRPNIGYRPIHCCKYFGIGSGQNIGWENISVLVSAGPISVQPYQYLTLVIMVIIPYFTFIYWLII